MTRQRNEEYRQTVADRAAVTFAKEGFLGNREGVSTTAVLRLLREGEPEEVCAAALVLGRLAPSDRRVVPALVRTLDDSPVPLKPYLLDALGHFDDPKALRAIAAFLSCEGSLREQAVRLLQARGPDVVDELKKLYAKTPERNATAFIRVFAAIGAEPALEFLVGLLPNASFDLARNVAAALRRFMEAAPRPRRRYLVDLLRQHLATADRDDASSTIAALRILAVLDDARAITPAVERIAETSAHEVRLHALETLGQVPIPASRQARLGKLLLPLATSDRDHELAVRALRVIRRFSPPVLGEDALLDLALHAHADVARAAIRELGNLSGPAVVSGLLDVIRQREPTLQGAAATVLAELEGSVESLLEAHEDPRYDKHKETIRTILASKTAQVDPATFRRRARGLIATAESPEILAGRLRMLAAVNRPALNRTVESRAAAALRMGDAGHARNMLEPLVRHRLATASGRYLLSIAHLKELTGARGEDHFRRALQLLGPLARLSEWSLRRRLAAEHRIPDATLERVAAHMKTRPESEREVAEVLLARLRETRGDAPE